MVVEIIKGDNQSVPVDVQNSQETASIQNQIDTKGAEALKAFQDEQAAGSTAPNDVKVETTPPVTDKAEVPTQFQTEDGKLDKERLDQSQVNLEEANQKAEAEVKALKDYTELRRSFTKTSQERGQLAQSLPSPETQAAPAPGTVNAPDLLTQVQKGLELNAPQTILDVARMAAETTSRQLMDRQEELEFNTQASRHLETNSELAKPENFKKVNDLLAVKPYLWKGNDPIGDAAAMLGFAPGRKTSGNAQPKRPMLGGGRSIPPPPSGTVSEDDRLVQLQSQAKADLASGKTESAALEEAGKLMFAKFSKTVQTK